MLLLFAPPQLVGMLCLPESPRYLISRGHTREVACVWGSFVVQPRVPAGAQTTHTGLTGMYFTAYVCPGRFFSVSVQAGFTRAGSSTRRVPRLCRGARSDTARGGSNQLIRHPPARFPAAEPGNTRRASCLDPWMCSPGVAAAAGHQYGHVRRVGVQNKTLVQTLVECWIVRCFVLLFYCCC